MQTLFVLCRLSLFVHRSVFGVVVVVLVVVVVVAVVVVVVVVVIDCCYCSPNS